MIRKTGNKKVKVVVLTMLTVLLLLQAVYVSLAEETSDIDEMNRLCGSTFNNSQYLTREQFSVVIAKVFLKTESDAALPFVDADKIKNENIGYLAALYQEGLLSGSLIGERLYMLPDDSITRQEAITFLGRIITGLSDSVLPFSDADTAAPYAYRYLAWFADKKIIIGYPDGTLGPRNIMTAGELASLVLRTLEYMNSNQFIGTGMRGSINEEITAARFTLPHRVLFDRNDVPIVVDTYNNMIRAVVGNQVTTYIGRKIQLDDNSYQKGYYLDTELKDALLNRPADAVYNAKNEIFIADSANDVIRFVREGIVYTFSGTTAGHADGSPKTAKFNRPMAIAIDGADYLYVADTLNNCIRKIDPLGNVTTIAGTPGKPGFADGAASGALFLEPAGIAVSGDGKTIYVSDTGNHRIRKIENGNVTTIAGASGAKDADGYPEGGFRNGAAGQAMFNQPAGITIVDGLIIVADSGNHMVRSIDRAGNVSTICGNGEAGDEEVNLSGAFLNRPMGVCYHKGFLYIADTMNNRIKAIPFENN